MLARSVSGPIALGAPPLYDGLCEALRRPDMDRVAQLVEHARARGTPADELYVESVRPALRDATSTWPVGEREGREAVALAGLSETFAVMAAADEELGNGAGRRALVVGENRGAPGLDTQVLVELLERAGWMVSALTPDHLDAHRLIERLEPAAIVLVGESAGGRAWPTLRVVLDTALGLRPLVVLCRFDADLAAVAAEDRPGIDAFVSRPAAALALLRDRFAASAGTAWGVALHRELDTLVVTPSGRLNTATAGRLRAIVESRAGTFAQLVLNLADLSAADEPALRETLRWVSDNGWQAPRLAPRPPG